MTLALTLAAAGCGDSDTGGPTSETGSLYAGPTTSDVVTETGDEGESSSSSDTGGDGDGDADGGDGDGDGDGG